MRVYLFLIIMVFCFAPVAVAMPGMADKAADKFAQIDKNGDGNISIEEFKAFYPQMHDAAFEAIDKSKDKLICADEWKEFTTGHSMDRAGSGMGGMTMPPAMGNSPEAQKARDLFELAPRGNAQ